MKIFLAPMEGVVDALVREIWTALGGYDLCFTEFIRVNSQLYPAKVFYRHCPELLQGSQTSVGTPVWVQLLGGDANCLAENAALAASLGDRGIDLNFGCPAPTVNRHDGGATLLQFPERIFSIVQSVRAAVPKEIPVSAKIRLGCEDTSLCLDNAHAVSDGGASHLTVHCRTKLDFYRPPARWEWLPSIKDNVKIPVIANGEIWNLADFESCHRIGGCDGIMLGRGAIANPFLALELKSRQSLASWDKILDLLILFFDRCDSERGQNYAVCRAKQWFGYLRRTFPEAQDLFQSIKVVKSSVEFRAQLRQTLVENLRQNLPDSSLATARASHVYSSSKGNNYESSSREWKSTESTLKP